VKSPAEMLRRAGAAAARLALSRATFASLELAQARDQAARWLLLALLAAVLMLAALGCGSALLVAVLWERAGWVTLAALTVLYAATCAALVMTLIRRAQDSPPLLSATLEELRKDSQALVGDPGAAEP